MFQMVNEFIFERRKKKERKRKANETTLQLTGGVNGLSGAISGSGH